MAQGDDWYAIGRLLHFGLRVDAHPTTDSEYRALIDRYRSDQDFRGMLQGVCSGLGLRVFQINDYGLTLVPASDSIFALKLTDYRPNAKANERLVEGLIQIAIMATVFPRAEDLEQDSSFARQPISAVEVDETLRRLCDRMDTANRDQPDLLDTLHKAGLYEAWRAYQNYPKISDSKGPTASVYSMILYAFDFLQRQGCFVPAQRGAAGSFRPTHRYQQMVQEFTASFLAQTVRDLLATPPSSEGT